MLHIFVAQNNNDDVSLDELLGNPIIQISLFSKTTLAMFVTIGSFRTLYHH